MTSLSTASNTQSPPAKRARSSKLAALPVPALPVPALPSDCVLVVLKWLDGERELGLCACVCRDWRRLVRRSEGYWRLMCRQQWGERAPSWPYVRALLAPLCAPACASRSRI